MRDGPHDMREGLGYPLSAYDRKMLARHMPNPLMPAPVLTPRDISPRFFGDGHAARLSLGEVLSSQRTQQVANNCLVLNWH